MATNHGKNLRLTIFGQSHAEAIGMVLEGFPSGFFVDRETLQQFLNRRAPGRNSFSTARKEEDQPRFLAGLVENVTCGTPISAVIFNSDSRSTDYEELRRVPRPGHADYPAFVKYGSAHDVRGGGAFSGRLTAPLCIAGGICLQYLKQNNIFIAARIASIASFRDETSGDLSEWLGICRKEFPVLDDRAGAKMRECIASAKAEGDSVGGIVEASVWGFPAGLGGELYDGLDGKLAAALFAIPGVKGVEFGAGFEASCLRGSENNDLYCYENGTVRTETNRHGGILGGISTGMPITLRVAFKPTPSIAKPQQSVDMYSKETVSFCVKGRHDPCIVPRAVPCVEAALAVELTDSLLDWKG